MQKTEMKPRGTEQTSQDDIENEHRTENSFFGERRGKQQQRKKQLRNMWLTTSTTTTRFRHAVQHHNMYRSESKEEEKRRVMQPQFTGQQCWTLFFWYSIFKYLFGG